MTTEELSQLAKELALLVIEKYYDEELFEIFTEKNPGTNKRTYYKYCVTLVTLKPFTNKLSHEVDLEVQRIRRDQQIAQIETQNALEKEQEELLSDQKRYYKEIGGGDEQIGRELLDKYLND